MELISKGTTRSLEWMYGPVSGRGEVILQVRDSRALSVIAAEFEGCERLERRSEHQGDLVLEGYTVLRGIQRPDPRDSELVQLTLARPDEKDEAKEAKQDD